MSLVTVIHGKALYMSVPVRSHATAPAGGPVKKEVLGFCAKPLHKEGKYNVFFI